MLYILSGATSTTWKEGQIKAKIMKTSVPIFIKLFGIWPIKV